MASRQSPDSGSRTRPRPLTSLSISATRSSLAAMWLYRLIGRVSSSAATRRIETASRPSASATASAVSTIRARVRPSPDGPVGSSQASSAARLGMGRGYPRRTPYRYSDTVYGMTDPTTSPTLILGAGPAGLTAGYLLAKRGLPVIVFEAEDQVGGIAKTEVRDGPGGEYRFDLGGHRFFTKVQEVDDLWHEIMREEFLLRPRMSRIYWRKRFLHYPLQGGDVIRKLGPVELTRCLASYAWAKLRPSPREDTLEEWVTNRFGKRLFTHFFKSYNEKLWGVPTTEIRSEFAAQRIKGLSFFSAAKAAFVGNRGNEIKSLIGEFHYPRFGPGQMWEAMTEEIRALGGQVLMQAPVERIRIEDGCVAGIVAGGHEYDSPHVISSLPLRNVVGMADPAPPAEVLEAAQGIRYRDFLTVSLVLDGQDLFPDNWIYIHEPDVQVGRIQNFRSWSPWMVPDPDQGLHRHGVLLLRRGRAVGDAG